jgi:serine O-acetyltransferase
MTTNSSVTSAASHRALAERVLRMGRKAGESVLVGALPSQDEIAAIVNDVLSVILPGTRRTRLAEDFSHDDARDRLAEVLADLETRLGDALYLAGHRRCEANGKGKDACKRKARTIVGRTLAALPELRAALALDVQIACEADPAATGPDEVIACYPGLYAIAIYRAANRILREGGELVPRMMTEYAHGRTGIDIHPGATIGSPFFIDHGTGIVVGETTRIGNSVRIYQGVTLGALSLKRKKSGSEEKSGKHVVPQRHPTIEDDVVIYANATILGGDTVIGKGAVVGANAWITYSVPAGRRVGGG